MFQLNPNGRALEPDYSEETNNTFETIQNFQNQGVMPALVSSEDVFANSESCNESQSDKCFCYDRSHTTLESNSHFSFEEKFNECG